MARPPHEGPGRGDTTDRFSIPHGTPNGLPRSDPRNGTIRFVHVWLCDLIANTHSLSAAAMGAYVRLWIEMLRRKGPIADDPKALARITGLSRAGWAAARKELLECPDLSLDQGEWHSSTAADRISYFETRSMRNRRNITKRWGTVEDAP
jgi:uncharacterized protein YdaU (DUF1376 family)